MKFVLEIDMDNDAFVNYPATELSVLLDATKAQVRAERTDLTEAEGKLRDTNGNAVGAWKVYD